MARALLIGSSGGIGTAVATELRARGYDVIGLSRSEDRLDLRDQEAVERVLSAQSGPFDLIFVASGVLAVEGKRPEKSLGEINGAAMADVMAANAIGPALVLKHVPSLVAKSERSVVAVLTARVGSIGDNQLGGWYAYRASKAAANQIVRTASIELRRTRPGAIVIALHPGTVDTPFTANYPAHKKVGAPAAAANMLNVLDGLGPDDTGRFFDYSGQEVPW